MRLIVMTMSALLAFGSVSVFGLPTAMADSVVQSAGPPPSDRRILYSAARPPVLKLADGQRRMVRSVLNVPQRMKYGDAVWDDDGVPPGETWIRIDLATQTLSVFRAGHEIGTAVILYGTDRKPTPTGVFRILQRAAQHRSSLYDAEMPFMLRLTNDGVAIHASNVRAGSATHGCIGVPIDFARRMFGQARRGTVVAIVRTRTAPSTAAS